MNAPDWPKRSDGSPMTLGEMSREEQDRHVKFAIHRLDIHFKRPEVQQHLRKVLK